MFKVLGEYKGKIKNGIIIAGEVFLPLRRRTVKMDSEQLMKMTEAEENGWFVIHSCDPENPFKKEVKVEVEEVIAEEKVKEVKTEETSEEEVATEERVEKEKVEEVKAEPKKTKSRKKPQAKEEE